MTIRNCPVCTHDRDVHGDGSCYRLVEAVTAGGETHLTLCGYCGWVPMIFKNGSRGWRHEAGRKVEENEHEDTSARDEVAAAILEVERLLASR